MSEIERIEILFPVPVALPEGWEQRLVELVSDVCYAYERDNSDRSMWPAGVGAAPIWNEPNEPTFDTSVYQISVAERERFDTDPEPPEDKS